MVLTMIFLMIMLTGLALMMKFIFKSYRHKLELYQHLLVEFIPDDLVEVAVKYQPEDPIIMEEESQYNESSYRGSNRPGYRKVPFIPQTERISAPLGTIRSSQRKSVLPQNVLEG